MEKVNKNGYLPLFFFLILINLTMIISIITIIILESQPFQIVTQVSMKGITTLEPFISQTHSSITLTSSYLSVCCQKVEISGM